jgi:hypothetical protein
MVPSYDHHAFSSNDGGDDGEVDIKWDQYSPSPDHKFSSTQLLAIEAEHHCHIFEEDLLSSKDTRL